VISLLPDHRETLVLPKPATVVYQILTAATSHKLFVQPDEKKLYFNGWVRETRFRISLRQRRANHYLPLVIGQIESTSTGCLLFLDYKLFPMTRLLLTLWTIFLVMGSFFVWYQTKTFFILPSGFAIIILIHAIVRSNFSLQLKPTQEAMHNLLA
jgi:hypothetical protein